MVNILHTGETKSLAILLWQVSGVRCHLSCVAPTCHMSLTPTAIAADPPPANIPIMRTMMLMLLLTLTIRKYIGFACNFWPKFQILRHISVHIFSPRIFFCRWSICLMTFVNKSNETLKKLYWKPYFFCQLIKCNFWTNQATFLLFSDLESARN